MLRHTEKKPAGEAATLEAHFGCAHCLPPASVVLMHALRQPLVHSVPFRNKVVLLN